ncbi:hypothetical protein [Leptolyngbya sp. CCY15150]|uniref:hypothetical protein n=1 Tax=Leptolyngbya sp. CCY15150 TaxID=2767772 RepID=UPI001951EF41|nr:hypothetical protein [Leptolyngbya sp. CCY15150]
MRLNQIVEVNQTGVLRSSVNLDMVNNPEDNRDLCRGFIFNYNHQQPQASTVGILSRLRDSYRSRNESNIHLMVQQYGKGKSHFAVAIANFFGKAHESAEVQGVLDQVKQAVSGQSDGLIEGLQAFKKSRRFLVICLRGDLGGDLRKQFLQAVNQTLDAEHVGDGAIARHICGKPLQFLERLNPADVKRANDYLYAIQHPDGDIKNLTNLLRNNNTSAIRAVKQVAEHLLGIVPDFQDSIDIEAILSDLITTLCTGENAVFGGILILFDELYYYLKDWANDEIGAGGTALQNITNICENYKGKIALLGFSQTSLQSELGISANTLESYRKLSTRLAPRDATYTPASSLELVIDSLLVQKQGTDLWQQFTQRWQETLVGEARAAYETYIPAYKARGWSFPDFCKHLSLGCFPLHPITAYLLANLPFSQDRSAIEFLRGAVTQIIQEQPVEVEGRLNFIYPVTLVEAFLDNFENQGNFHAYQEARHTVLNSDNPDELLTLNALLLYHASGGSLTKRDNHPHEDILSRLTGLSPLKQKEALHVLTEVRQLIYYQAATRTYIFFPGKNPNALEDKINDIVRDKTSTVDSLVQYSRGQVSRFLQSSTCMAREFVHTHKQVGDDWQFVHRFYTIDGLRRALSSSLKMEKVSDRGILAYVLARSVEELEEFRRTVDKDLERSPNRHQVAIAIPTEPVGDLDRILLKLQTLEQQEPEERRFAGEAYTQLIKRWRDHLDITLKRMVQSRSCSFHSITQHKVPTQQATDPNFVISALLTERYSFVPPINSIDKLRTGHATGSKVTGFIAKQLFNGSLGVNSLPSESTYQTILDEVFCTSWKLFRKTSSDYKLQVPTETKVRTAWDKISDMTQLNGQVERTITLNDLWLVLSSAPYGYNEYTFTVLLAGWLAYHRREVTLRGSKVVKPRRNQPSTIITQALKEWASTDILDKPKLFVAEWIEKGNSTKLIRRETLKIPELPTSSMAYDQAQEYLIQAQRFLDSSEADESELRKVRQTVQLVTTEVGRIDQWFTPVEKAEALNDATSLLDLIHAYTTLFQTMPSPRLEAEVISVHPSAAQSDRQQNVQNLVRDRLEHQITALCQQAKTLTDLDSCKTYRHRVHDTIKALKKAPHSPPHFVEQLQAADQLAQTTSQQIETTQRLQSQLQQVQTLARQLGSQFSQQDYTQTQAQIQHLLTTLPADTEPGREARQMVQDLELLHKELIQQIDAWEERETSAAASASVINLIEEINQQRIRFTEPADVQRVQVLLDKLKAKVSAVQAQDDAAKLLQQELSTTLTNAQQKLQRLRDLPFTKIAEIFQVYQDLISIHFPDTLGRSDAVQQAHAQLQDFKQRGRSLLSSRFQDICDRKITTLKDAQHLGDLLQQAGTLVSSSDEFADIAASVDASQQLLVSRRTEIEQQLKERKAREEDLKIMQQIRQYQSERMSTLALCEDAMAAVNSLYATLHQPTVYGSEVEQIRQLLTQRIADNQQRLQSIRDRLASLETLKDLELLQADYARLELAFHQSSLADDYQQLAPQIQALRADLETLHNLEMQYQASGAIADCQDLIDQLGDIQVSLHDLGRFQGALTHLETKLKKKIQSYLQGLNKLEQRLSRTETVAEAQAVQEALLQQAQCYTASEENHRYQALVADSKLVIEFLQQTESMNTSTLEACSERIQWLMDWKNAIPNLSSALSDRLQTVLDDLTSRQQLLRQERIEQAEAWLKDLGQRAGQADRLTAQDPKRLDVFRDIQDSIHHEHHQYTAYLTSDKKKTITYIEHQCRTELQKSESHQIIMRFRQLPRPQRQQLYQQLAQFLDAPDAPDGGV